MKTLNPKRWVGFVPEGFETLDKLDDVGKKCLYMAVVTSLLLRYYKFF